MSPAATVAKSSLPQSEIRTPQSPPPPTSAFRVPRSNLLLDFLTGEVPVEVILADHNLTPDQFLAWIESEETQHRLDTLAKIDAARAKAIAATSRADALHSLRRVLVQSKSLGGGEIRRAASAILRYDAAANKPAPKATADADAASTPIHSPSPIGAMTNLTNGRGAAAQVGGEGPTGAAELESNSSPAQSSPTPLPAPTSNFPLPTSRFPSLTSPPPSPPITPSPPSSPRPYPTPFAPAA